MGTPAMKRIALIATLDTKGFELQFVKDLIEGYGCGTIVIDTGILGTPAFHADFPREAVARAGGIDLLCDVGKKTKRDLIGGMARGAANILRMLHESGKLAGILALGGGQGTFIGTTAMKALPLGVPKVMVSTLGAGNLRGFVDTKDIAVFNSVTDILGLNAISRRILSNAAAVVGMTRVGGEVIKGETFTVGATMLGTTTPGMMRAKSLMEGWQWEVVTFHANGTGGKAMEELAAQGFFDGIFDFSTHEVLAHACGGIFSSGPTRLETAGRMGIPQLVVPGGVDYLIMGPVSSLSEEILRRPVIVHNDEITLVRTTREEMEKVAAVFSEKLNQARGPAAVVIPARGYSEPNHAGGSFYNPEADEAFVRVLRDKLSPSIQVHVIDAHINDPEFARYATDAFRRLCGV